MGKYPNPVVLNFVSLTDPIRVRFSIDERSYLSLARRLRGLSEESAGEKMNLGLVLTLADGTVHPFPGEVVAADAAINSETGTFTLEADFANPDGIVLAGQFARVQATAEILRGALLVPSRSTSELQGNFRVYVVDDEDKVEIRPVKLGPVIDNFRVVTSGLEADERVAIEIMKLQPGMTIMPKRVVLNEDGTIVKGRDESASPDAASGNAVGDENKGA